MTAKAQGDLRKKHGILEHVRPVDLDEYERVVKEATHKYSVPSAPQMPILPQAAPALDGRFAATQDKHHENLAVAGHVSGAWYAMVHKPITIREALRIPNAKASLDKEWAKLHAACWDRTKPFERRNVEDKYSTRGETAHFGTINLLMS